MSTYARAYLGVPTFNLCPTCRTEKRLFSFRRTNSKGKSRVYEHCNVCERRKKQRNEKT